MRIGFELFKINAKTASTASKSVKKYHYPSEITVISNDEYVKLKKEQQAM